MEWRGAGRLTGWSRAMGTDVALSLCGSFDGVGMDLANWDLSDGKYQQGVTHPAKHRSLVTAERSKVFGERRPEWWRGGVSSAQVICGILLQKKRSPRQTVCGC